MAFCPQCGTSLGQDARGCACGWRSSRRTLWIVLAVILGLLFLACACCGGVAWWGFRRFQEHGTPLMLLQYRIEVVTWAEDHGGALPESLEAAGRDTPAEPGKPRERGRRRGPRIHFEGGQGGPFDSWLHPVRYGKKEDGTFEIRSAGPDGKMDTADDLVEAGRAGEDLALLRKEQVSRMREFNRTTFGFALDEGGPEEEAAPPAGPEAPKGPDAPKAPPAPPEKPGAAEGEKPR